MSGLWSHAIVLSLNCDLNKQQSIIQRYRDASLSSGSPIFTVYRLVRFRSLCYHFLYLGTNLAFYPIAQLLRLAHGETTWRPCSTCPKPNLLLFRFALISSVSFQSYTAEQLGTLLLSHNEIAAAHSCYLLADASGIHHLLQD